MRSITDQLSRYLLACALSISALPAHAQEAPPGCEPTQPDAVPALHCIVLVPTEAAQGARGVVKLYLARSPFGLSVTADGRTIYDIHVEIRGLQNEPGLEYIAWVTTTDLEQRSKLGTLGEDQRVTGRTDWNRFMVVVTQESTPDVERWSGPILFSASSPSGWLSSMLGEPIFGNNELPVQSRYCLLNKC